ncbi:hypothetical protein K457DRAFT_24260 [Linnemannia elongata AG-77]|uniref:Uncharacterized protein n=1 Tax=Linnemannia elongata AG-77 TaxID=1314771 RepID=A0A197JH34_9FUNG|nr:hypothetical protein K457DRAFT_24260 [Linnemannia elongata AG-77]
MVFSTSQQPLFQGHLNTTTNNNNNNNNTALKHPVPHLSVPQPTFTRLHSQLPFVWLKPIVL